MDSSLDPRIVLLGYYAHIVASERLSSEFYAAATFLSPSSRAVLQEKTLIRAKRAEGEIASLEEYGIERWQATNGAGAC